MVNLNEPMENITDEQNDRVMVHDNRNELANHENEHQVTHYTSSEEIQNIQIHDNTV